MSIQTKNNFKRSSRLVGILLFAFLFFFNIKIMLSDDSSGIADLSLFGVKINLFETAFAESGGGSGGSFTGHLVDGPCTPSCIGYYPESHNCWQCTYTPFNPYCTISAAYCSQY